MDLYNYFLKTLRESGLSDSDIRFMDAQELLKKQLNNCTVSKFSEKCGINRGTLSYMLRGKRAIPLNLLDKCDLTKCRLAIKNSNITIRIPNSLTKELAYLVGVLRDGTISKESNNEYCCSFYNKNIELLSKIKSFVEELFDIKTEIRRFGDVHGIRIRSLTLYLFFKLVFEAKEMQEKWDTPNLIKSSEEECKKWYVSGFFDAEGGIPHIETNIRRNKKYLYVKFVQKNKESLEFIKSFLESKGIKMRSIYLEKNKWVLKVSNSSIPAFAKFIVTFHPEKSSRLAELSRIFS